MKKFSFVNGLTIDGLVPTYATSLHKLLVLQFKQILMHCANYQRQITTHAISATHQSKSQVVFIVVVEGTRLVYPIVTEQRQTPYCVNMFLCLYAHILL